MFPEADIPVIQLSLDYNQSAQYHYELAKELATLRKKGVLIILYGGQSLNHTFSDTTYLAFISKKNNNFDLTIKQQKRGYEYYLSR